MITLCFSALVDNNGFLFLVRTRSLVSVHVHTFQLKRDVFFGFSKGFVISTLGVPLS